MLSLRSDPSPLGLHKSGQLMTEMVGQSGRHYLIERVLQEKVALSRRVYLGTAHNRKFVLKEMSQPEAKYYLDMYRDLQDCPYLRLAEDVVPERSTLVYQFFTDHLLRFIQKDLPINLTKRILKDTLRGLAALHDQDIVHTDIKANNILVNHSGDHHDLVVEQVQLADLEDAVYVPSDSDIVGKQVGNWMWRSPEAHAQGPVNEPSDIFSFGVVCIYAITKRVIFAVGQEELGEGEELLAHVLERQISFFADEEGLNGLLKHLGDNSPWCNVLTILRDGFNRENPRRPFAMWTDIEAGFKDLTGGLMNFDPSKRLTAHEALAHPWFEGV